MNIYSFCSVHYNSVNRQNSVGLMGKLSNIFNFSSKKKLMQKQKELEEKIANLESQSVDPLDPGERIKRLSGWNSPENEFSIPTIDAFPRDTASDYTVMVGDSSYSDDDLGSIVNRGVMDSCANPTMSGGRGGFVGADANVGVMPANLQAWYMSQSFIGHQACAIIAQHWLVDKACTQAGEDAVRNGWRLKGDGEDDFDEGHKELIEDFDIKFKIRNQLVQLNRFNNIFGIRICIFVVKSDDPQYYEKPFNIDGVKKGSYVGISQVDPYWTMPIMTRQATADPADPSFYEPEYWTISGKRYHKSHLIIARGPEPADILKPMYIFGGIPMTQRIYERVYAAERTANEAPLLATNKRTTAIHMDLAKAALNENALIEKLKFWVKFRDNHAIKILGKDESMEQFDTNLSDFDSLIMNQFQLVAAIAKTPATKLLGTSPKGFNATGEFETVSYHEELESIQAHIYQPFLERHYQILLRSLGLDMGVSVVWEPVDSMSAAAQADINHKNALTNEIYANIGAVSPDEVRQRIRDDKYSGFDILSDEEAETEMGLTPENEADLIRAETSLAKEKEGGRESSKRKENNPGWFGNRDSKDAIDVALVEDGTLDELEGLVNQLELILMPDAKSGLDFLGAYSSDSASVTPSIKGSYKPSTIASIKGMISQIKSGKIVDEMPESQHPKFKTNGLVIGVENPKGTVRRGKDWEVTMPHHYGYIKGFRGEDGDHMDCFFGDNPDYEKVYVIYQVDENGKFDEHKCMLGFDSKSAAVKGYNDAFSDGWDGLGHVKEMTVDQFKKWLNGFVMDDCSTPLDAECIERDVSGTPWMSM